MTWRKLASQASPQVGDLFKFGMARVNRRGTVHHVVWITLKGVEEMAVNTRVEISLGEGEDAGKLRIVKAAAGDFTVTGYGRAGRICLGLIERLNGDCHPSVPCQHRKLGEGQFEIELPAWALKEKPPDGPQWQGWSEAEDGIIRRYFPGGGADACEGRLPNRTAAAIRSRASKIRVTRVILNDEPPSSEEVTSKLMGDPAPGRSALEQKSAAKGG
jgi:hypothetical protein